MFSKFALVLYLEIDWWKVIAEARKFRIPLQ